MDHTYNRRDFIKATAGTAAAGTLTLTGAAHAEEASGSQSWMPQTWDAEADAVIVGYGCAGPVTALELAKQGLTSLLIEKADRDNAGGNCSVSGGYVMSSPDNTSPYTADGIVTSTLAGVDETYAEAVLPYINESSEYLVSLGVDLDTETFPGLAFAHSDEYSCGGMAFFKCLESAVDQHADLIDVRYETPAIGLVQNPVTGEILGVKAGTQESPVYLKARRGVVMATGGFEADQQMVNSVYTPGLSLPTIGTPNNTGDGTKMLMRAGVKVENYAKCLEFAAMGFRQASAEVGTGLTLPGYPANTSYIFVNRDGKRFMDETASLQHSKDDRVFGYTRFEGGLHTTRENTGYPNVPAFIVFDEAHMSAGPVMSMDNMGWNSRGLYTWSDDNQAELERGWIVKADTLEELAAKVYGTDMWGNEVSIDPDGLAEQVKAYNEACETGDDEFGRSDLEPIGEGPYYAAEIVPVTLYTIGGASVSTRAEALDWNDQPVARLYLAGNVGNPYMVHSPALVGATAYARLAAEQITELQPWE